MKKYIKSSVFSILGLFAFNAVAGNYTHTRYQDWHYVQKGKIIMIMTDNGEIEKKSGKESILGFACNTQTKEMMPFLKLKAGEDIRKFMNKDESAILFEFDSNSSFYEFWSEKKDIYATAKKQISLFDDKLDPDLFNLMRKNNSTKASYENKKGKVISESFSLKGFSKTYIQASLACKSL